MTVVVEVGPLTVRGPGNAPPEWVSQAIDCIDDATTLVGERPVEVVRLWSDVLGAVSGQCSGALALVVPTWWSAARVDVLTEAACDLTTEVTVLRRAALLCADTRATVVELCAELVVVARPGTNPAVYPRDDDTIAELVGAANAVLLDLAGAVAPPPPTATAQLRAAGIPVSYSDRRCVAEAAEQAGAAVPEAVPGTRRRRNVPALLAGAAVALGAAGGVVLARPSVDQPAATAVLVEGRAAVRVPADWAVERITAGPGSARVRIAAPGGSAALHLTQSTAPTTEQVGESLRRALQAEPPGVFTDFDAGGRVGGRPAVTYREHRPGSEITWAVVVDGTLRIALGCQSAAGRRHEIAEACQQAVGSARAVR